MVGSKEIKFWLERNLMRVQKPGRYTGGEHNQVTKPWDDVEIHVGLAFPDIYDIGVPNLGLAIFYESINDRSDALAERFYAPWIDMEERMRSEGIPLFSLETSRPAADFDLIGFTIPYESLDTNVLNMLDLAGIPVHASERNDSHPIIIAGGHSTYNPEPMSAFIDAFVIGEGEEVFHEVINSIAHARENHFHREETLILLASIPGVYVPSLYRVDYHPDGTIKVVQSCSDKAADTILKRVLKILPPPPTRLIVPSIDVVHNRVSVEIMRGCTRGCRFCHAGMVTRPVRERSPQDVLDAIRSSLEQTGFEEIALLSLSSSDYTQIKELVDSVSAEFVNKNLIVSLPSLRIESFSLDLMNSLKGSRQGGFTLAPEAATDRLRQVINKPISSEQLVDTTREIYRRGWHSIKLYFMIGHPGETLDDVREIVHLCKTVLREGRAVAGGRASLHAGVSTFVPKPHTPFQWVPCNTPKQIEEKLILLKNELRGPNLKLTWNNPRETQMEAWLSRGDRRLGGVIFQAWKNGARFDAWQDQVNHEAWTQAFVQNGLDPAFYSQRQRGLDEIFPWDHISTGVRKKHLRDEYLLSLEEKTRPDCRDKCYGCGILSAYINLNRDSKTMPWKCDEAISTDLR